MLQVDSGYFCAGVIIINTSVVKAAPILNWAIGKEVNYFLEYCKPLKVAKVQSIVNKHMERFMYLEETDLVISS